LVSNSVANPLGIASAACLALAAALSAGVHLGLGAWKIGMAKRMLKGKSPPRKGIMRLPTFVFALQSLSFVAGIILFVMRLMAH